jgi:hypothetical protein
VTVLYVKIFLSSRKLLLPFQHLLEAEEGPNRILSSISRFISFLEQKDRKAGNSWDFGSGRRPDPLVGIEKLVVCVKQAPTNR